MLRFGVSGILIGFKSGCDFDCQRANHNNNLCENQTSAINLVKLGDLRLTHKFHNLCYCLNTFGKAAVP